MGARHPVEALGYPGSAPDRGSVRLVLVDRDALGDAEDTLGS